MSKFFLVARYTEVMRDKTKSSLPGNAKDTSNWMNNESIVITKNLKNRDYTEASVILDVANGKVVKNRFDVDRSFEDLWKYYLTHYADHINGWLNAQLKR